MAIYIYIYIWLCLFCFVDFSVLWNLHAEVSILCRFTSDLRLRSCLRSCGDHAWEILPGDLSGVTERGVGTGWVISLPEIKSTLLQSRGLFAAMWARRAYRRHLLARRSWEPAGAGQGSLGRTGPDQGTKGKKTNKNK